jgi:hypothetical protein
MTDQNAPGAVRDALIGAMGFMTDIHMNAPLDTIVRAGQVRARRQRHRRLGVAGAAAAVAAVPAAALLLANGHQASHQVAGPASGNAAARLTAWTVETAADGRLVVTIRELRDPAGLQRTLRADGVPASVTFLGRPNAACTPYESSTSSPAPAPARHRTSPLTRPPSRPGPDCRSARNQMFLASPRQPGRAAG